MSNAKIVKKLNTLANLRAEKETLIDEETKEIDALLSDELKKKIHTIKTKYSKKQGKIDKDLEELETLIKEGTLEYGETIKGEGLQAVYAKGRVSWNNDLLMGYAIDHPEVLKFRSQGKAYITIRR